MIRKKTSNYLLLALVAGILGLSLWQAHAAHTYIKDVQLLETVTSVEELEAALSSVRLKTYQVHPVQPFSVMELENLDVIFIKGNHPAVYVNSQQRRSVAVDVTEGKLRISNTSDRYVSYNKVIVISPQSADVYINMTKDFFSRFEIAGFGDAAPQVVVNSGTAVVGVCLKNIQLTLRQEGNLYLSRLNHFPMPEASHISLQLENAGAFSLSGEQKLASLSIQGSFAEGIKNVRTINGVTTATNYDINNRIDGFSSCDSLYINLVRPSSQGQTTLNLPKSWEGFRQYIQTDENVRLVWKED